MGSDRRPFAPLGWVFVGLSLLLAVVTVRTAARNRALVRELARLEQARVDDYAPRPGSQLPDLNGWGLDGRQMRVPAAGGSGATLVLVFTPTCPVCASNWPAWEAVAAGLREKPVARVVAVNLRGTSSEGLAYEKQHALERFTYLARVDQATIDAFHLRFVPHTLLLDASGAVRFSRTGPLTPELQREVLALAGSTPSP